MAPGSILYFGPFALYGTDDGLWCGPERRHLTAKAEAVLRYLVAHPGRLVRKADLLAAVWPDAHVSDWGLTTCIREIRHVLGDVAKAPQYIATVHRQGYRFIAPVTEMAMPPQLPVPAVSPQPPHTAPLTCEALQSAPTATTLEEEHKLVTILCAALIEAPALAARLGPERWYRLLQTVVGLTQEVLHHYAGTLTLATSDGFTAVFGAPVAQEDHARLAVLAAFELRQRLQDAPALHTQLAEGVLTLGMGLHAGLVVVGGLGQDPQQLATAVGAPLHMATRLQQQALQALAHLPAHRDTRRRAIEIHLALRESLGALGEYRRQLALLGEAEVLARALDDRARLVRVLSQIGSVCRQMGDLDGAMTAGRQALDLAVALGDRALQGHASHFLGAAYYAIGDFGLAAELGRWVVEVADRETGTSRINERITSRAWLTQTLSALGAFAEGRRHGEEALRLAMLEGRGQAPIIAYGCLGGLYLTQGDLAHAIRVLAEGLALCRASGMRSWLRIIGASMGYASTLHGRLAEGRALLEETISISSRMGGLLSQAARVAWLSEVCRLAGHPEEAWQHAHQALDLARQQKARGNEALALHQLGVVQAHADPPDAAQAEAHYQQALALAEELGMRPLQAHCYHGLGTLYARIGRQEHARTAMTTAIALYRAMDMTFWLPQAEAALAQAGRGEEPVEASLVALPPRPA